MDTVVEPPMVQQPSIPEQPRSVSPTESKKRAFDEVNGAGEGNAGMEYPNIAQISNGKENQQPLDVMTTNDPVPPATLPPPSTTGTGIGPIEQVPINTDTTSNAPVAAVTSEPIPIPPKTPVAMPTMPNKRVKLSPASMEAKRIEKEIRDRQRAEEKAKKEEERRIREEEKKKREEEKEEERKKREEKREEKRKAKEEERLAREEEKRKKEEERQKKERSQMRLNAFFTKPAAAPSGNSEPTSNNNENREEKSSEPSAASKPTSDYERDFPDFFLQSHTSVAPIHRFGRDEDALRHARETVEGILTKSNAGPSSIQSGGPFKPAELFRMMPYRRRRGKQKLPTVKEILIQMQGSSSNPINLTEEKDTAEVNEKPEDILRKIPVKSLKFGEDVRPPYQGTFTRPVPERSALRLSRNPFTREIPGINYDYDSEAEWEEPEEGEDLDSEGEEELSDDGEEDMNDFLDDADEDQPNPKRKLIVGDLEPTCSGLCWEDENGTNPNLSEYRMEIISDLPRFKLPIDPYSNSYWQTTPRGNTNAAKPTNSTSNNPFKLSSDMHPPPLPKNGEASASNLLSWTSTQPNAQSSKSQLSQASADASQTLASSTKARGDANSIKPKRPFPPEQLAELKEIVDGSDLTKTGLIEVVKKRFPKVPKGVLRDTVSDVAIRVGDKEADKKWVLKT